MTLILWPASTDATGGSAAPDSRFLPTHRKKRTLVALQRRLENAGTINGRERQ